MKPCCIELCDGYTTPKTARGMCEAHYKRALKGMPMISPIPVRKGRPAAEYFWPKVQITPGCWLWIGAVNNNGYGSFSAEGRFFTAHRWSYENANGGPIPDGLEIDHLCRNRGCVNPDHLEVVTRSVNNQRRWDAIKGAA